ncbi:hypothetical protein FIBSPDRAFT_851927 [Athelia psychrophila]|uniref:SWIM-type domain-containing protein n=1 Tax=Athelia psychrophila TaxID=1759441 RepID=A0A166S6U9_9AGAM|nr:hypothetical protein FIBSPDRAFT_851927 [Fibularhizoctonia sp. CBS 109695]
MVDRTRVGQELREEFKVLGSTGNVYNVVIDKTPSCTCPDATKGNHCKHIIFVYLKVLNVSTASGLWYQKALLTSELQTIFDQAPPAPNSVAHQRVRDAYARATGKGPATSAKAQADNGKRRVPGPDDDCAVCYEGMHGLDQKELTWCQDCGNPVHNECFTQWAASQRGKCLTCVHCRAKWVLPVAGAASGSGAARSAEGYINLANVAGMDDVRDTSTYYQGPRRGERHYGYQDYY